MMRLMRITFLGTGTSHGIPMIGCDCAVCRSDDRRNKRLRPSVLLETGNTCVLIDATPDFRTQALRAGIRQLDAVLLTHTHADHILGLDDLRAFTERTGRAMPVYGSTKSVADIQRIFPYAMTDTPTWPTLPSFSMRTVEPGQEFTIGEAKVRAIELPHGRGTVMGFVFGDEFAYLTDCSVVAPAIVQSLQGVTVLALDGLRHRPHPAHLTIKAAAAIAGQVGAKLTVLTHLCHEIEHISAERELPAAVRLACDEMQIEVSDGEYQLVR
jgi:phosphoribosyl 1,2-cyclic phosphate phosphodiesterase